LTRGQTKKTKEA